ncbi:glycosyltransferase family 2 protein, partial [Methylobacterium mesophilicum]
WMQPEPAPFLPDPGCSVRHLHVPGEPMPLAAARNRAAEAAARDLLVFLDVDCIPASGLVGAYAASASGAGGLLLGEVLYLPPEAGPALDASDLDDAALDSL